MAGEKEITCTDCFVVISKIETTLSLLRGDLVKIIISMLGMIAAQIGVKYMGTPWQLYIMVYVSIVASVFLLASTIFAWKKIPKLWRVLGFAASLMFAYASGVRIYFYGADTPILKELGIIMQFLHASIAVLMVIIFWRNGRWNGKDRRNP